MILLSKLEDLSILEISLVDHTDLQSIVSLHVMSDYSYQIEAHRAIASLLIHDKDLSIANTRS